MTRARRSSTALVALALVAAAAAARLHAGTIAAQQPAAQRPSFPSGTEIVTVDVVVTGRDGRPVLDLRQEDFTVSEDGKPQEITSFEAVHHEPQAPPEAGAQPKAPEPRTSSNLVVPGREPASFVILFDELHLAPAEAVRARDAVSRFLQEETVAGDRVALVGTFEGTRFTAAKHAAQNSSYRHLLEPRVGGLGVALATMGERLEAMLDVTIVYPEGTPGFWALLCGDVKAVIVDVRQWTIPTSLLGGDSLGDSAHRQRIRQWIEAQWAEKDRLIQRLLGESRNACN